MPVDTRWLTYADAASALGMTTESIRQRARREHWRKQIGNDGKALVLVSADTSRNPVGDPPDEPPASRPVRRPDNDTALMQARIGDMERHAQELRADLERERAERTQERERAEHLVGEVANLARELARVAEQAAGRERELQTRVTSAETTLAEIRSRSWWRRLAG